MELGFFNTLLGFINTMHSDIIIFSRINLVSFREVGIFGCRMCNFCYIHCFVPQQFEAVYTGQNKSSKSICPVVGSSASTRSKSKIERGISSSGNVGWACDQLLALRKPVTDGRPIISRPKWMSGLSPQWTPSFKSPYWLKRPVSRLLLPNL